MLPKPPVSCSSSHKRDDKSRCNSKTPSSLKLLTNCIINNKRQQHRRRDVTERGSPAINRVSGESWSKDQIEDRAINRELDSNLRSAWRYDLNLAISSSLSLEGGDK